MARTRSSSSGWRYVNPAYYLKRPKRLAMLFIAFVVGTWLVWDRQSLVREHEVRICNFDFALFSFEFRVLLWFKFCSFHFLWAVFAKI